LFLQRVRASSSATRASSAAGSRGRFSFIAIAFFNSGPVIRLTVRHPEFSSCVCGSGGQVVTVDVESITTTYEHRC